MPFPYVFTFYSYKGGVGRSMALMNVAYALAGRGRHVLVVDLDLEAPGVSGFLQRSGELAPSQGAHPKDILTLLTEAIRASKTEKPLHELAANLPPVSHFLRNVDADKLAPLKPRLGMVGCLDVVVADMDRNYSTRLAELGLTDLSQDQLIRVSSLLNSYFKIQSFPFRAPGLEDFESAIETKYDYVLVDSRTGITEIGGLCVGPLADRLVVVTGLNDQNVEGTLTFFNEVGIEPVARRKDSEKWDEDDPGALPEGQPGSLGPKPTVLVASPVPTGETALKNERMRTLEIALGIQPLQLSYHPLLALLEKNFVRDLSDQTLAIEYHALATRVMAQVGDDLRTLAIQAQRRIKDDTQKAVEIALRLSSADSEAVIPVAGQLVDVLSGAKDEPKFALPTTAMGEPAPTPKALPNRWRLLRRLCAFLAVDEDLRAAALSIWGWALFQDAQADSANAERFLESGNRKYEECIQLDPDPRILCNWGDALSGLAETQENPVAESLFRQAGEKYKEALQLKPGWPTALTNWGTALARHWTITKNTLEANRIFQEAKDKMDEAIGLDGSSALAFANLGGLLAIRSWRKTGSERDELFEQAKLNYARAVHLKPDFFEARFNWARTVVEQAMTKTGIEAKGLWQAFEEQWQKACELAPGNLDLLLYRADVLADRARSKAGSEADELLSEAIAAYAEAQNASANSVSTLHNWGVALTDHGRSKSGVIAESMFAEAEQKLKRALSIDPDSPAVNSNLGRVYLHWAIAKTEDQVEFLEKASLHFAKAVQLKPDSVPALSGWAATLSEIAKHANGGEAETLFTEAENKLSQALQLDPKSANPYVDWSTMLINRAANTEGQEALDLLERARTKCLEAERLKTGSGAYNLACIEGRLGNVTQALNWLRASIAAGNPLTQSQLNAEKDFELIRQEAAFIAFAESLPA